jgi:hypothetical protein
MVRNMIEACAGLHSFVEGRSVPFVGDVPDLVVHALPVAPPLPVCQQVAGTAVRDKLKEWAALVSLLLKRQI